MPRVFWVDFENNIKYWVFAIVDNISDIRINMFFYESRFANVWSQIKQIWVIFTHLNLFVVVARHRFKGGGAEIVFIIFI